jgi:hypothetical protein
MSVNMVGVTGSIPVAPTNLFNDIESHERLEKVTAVTDHGFHPTFNALTARCE